MIVARRLALGTAQFGLAYGTASPADQVPLDEVGTILRQAERAGIDTLDTAIAYGTSEQSLGQASVDGWRIVTKLPPLPSGVKIDSWVEAQLQGSQRRLGVARLDAVLLHRSADLLGPAGSVFRDALSQIKKKGIATAVGVSIYDPGELDALWPSFQPDIVQAPLNVFDRRLIASGWLERLACQGVRVHARSVFLQGLLLLTPEQRPPRFKRWQALLDQWLGWCREAGCSPLAAAIGFVAAYPDIEKLVIGVTSPGQFDQVLAAAAEPCPVAPPEFSTDDRDLIEPPRWKH